MAGDCSYRGMKVAFMTKDFWGTCSVLHPVPDAVGEVGGSKGYNGVLALEG